MNVTTSVLKYVESALNFTSRDYSDKIVIIAKSKDNSFRESFWIMKTDKASVNQKVLVAKKHLYDQYKAFRVANEEMVLNS